jgi:hypothetical protein
LKQKAKVPKLEWANCEYDEVERDQNIPKYPKHEEMEAKKLNKM